MNPSLRDTVSPLLRLLAIASAPLAARADLIAYDGFDYASGSSLTGATGPIGFSSPYTAAASGLTVSSPGLSYTDLPVAGNRLTLSGATNNGAFGILANSPETPGSTVYLSYLMQVTADTGYAGVSLFEGGTETLFTGNRSSGANVFGIEPKVGTSVNSKASCANLTLVVYRIDFTASGATIRLYVNPSSEVEPAVADAEAVRTSPLTYDRIRIQSSSATGVIDEIRLGDTFADVAPVTSGIRNRKLTILGSSVAVGVGASPTTLGWGPRLKTTLETGTPLFEGSNVVWQVGNASISGDNTSRVLSRFQNDVVNTHPETNIVVISLSLANEGLVDAASPQAIFDSFRNGVAEIIRLCRAQGYHPVINLCYPNNNYDPVEYDYVKRMNLLLNSWDLPSSNFLGAIDDSSGHWAAGYWTDALHPNAQGHAELYHSLVPSLFDAIALGKTATPQWQGTTGFLRLDRDDSATAPIRFVPTHTVHSYNLSFRVRTTGAGTIATVSSGIRRTTLEIRDGSLVHIGPGGQELVIPADLDDGAWHDIALSQRYASSLAHVYIDGLLKGTVSSQAAPDLFVVGGPSSASRVPAPLQADYQDVAIHRAAWTPDEALAHSKGALQQASMEICAPLADTSPAAGSLLENRAQSLAALTLETASAVSITASSPDHLTAESFTSATASLIWRNPEGEGDLIVERRPTEGIAAWAVVATLPTGSTSFEDTGLSPSTSYDYRVSRQEGPLRGDFSNVATITPGGQDSSTYSAWINTFFVRNTETYLVDFNTNPNPNYGGVIWNTVNSLSNPTPYSLVDTNNNGSAGIKLSINDSFDQFRSDNGSPLAGYAADAQTTQFALRDDNPLTGGMVFSGLVPDARYDFVFFARRGSLVSGYDYSGTYTFTGSGNPVVVQVNAASNTALTSVPGVVASSSGQITLKISAGPGAGSDFPVINFLQLTKPGEDAVYLANIDPTADPDNDGISNLEEYARQSDPTQPGPAGFSLENFTHDGPETGVGLRFTRDRRARDARYYVERSADLAAWEEDTSATESIVARSGAAETVVLTSAAEEEKMFYRLRIRLGAP